MSFSAVDIFSELQLLTLEPCNTWIDKATTSLAAVDHGK